MRKVIIICLAVTLFFGIFNSVSYAKPVEIDGFGDYKFGMTIDEVRRTAASNGDYLDPTYIQKVCPHLRTYYLYFAHSKIVEKYIKLDFYKERIYTINFYPGPIPQEKMIPVYNEIIAKMRSQYGQEKWSDNNAVGVFQMEDHVWDGYNCNLHVCLINQIDNYQKSILISYKDKIIHKEFLDNEINR